MAATTISTYSDALKTQIGTASVAPGAPAPANLSRSKMIVAPFKWTCASEVSGTSIGIVRIPKGARLLGGEIAASAALANSGTLAVGLAAFDGLGNIDDVPTGASTSTADAAVTTAQSDSTTCLKAAAVQSTTKVGFCLTNALGYGYELQKECWLTFTTGAGTISTEIVRGEVRYAVD